MYGSVQTLSRQEHPLPQFICTTPPAGNNVMQHLYKKSSKPSVKVFDVIAYCRSHHIDEREAKKLQLILGRLASRLEIQMNLTKRPERFR